MLLAPGYLNHPGVHPLALPALWHAHGDDRLLRRARGVARLVWGKGARCAPTLVPKAAMLYCSCCDRDLEESLFDPQQSGSQTHRTFRGDLWARFCRDCTTFQSSIPPKGCVYGFFDSSATCVYVGSTELADWGIRLREHAYQSHQDPEHAFYREIPGLQARLLQQDCHPALIKVYEYAWQLAMAPEGRELPVHNHRRAYDPRRGMWRLELDDQQLVIHFDAPKPWPWTESSNASKAALAGDMQLLKDYFFGRADIPQQPIRRPCPACGDSCKDSKHCPLMYLWEWSGADAEEDPRSAPGRS